MARFGKGPVGPAGRSEGRGVTLGMVRSVLRGIAACAPVGVFFVVAAQGASATPVKVFVRTNGNDSHSCLAAAPATACISISHAVAVADAIAASQTPPDSNPVIVEVQQRTYHDTIDNSVAGAATSPAGIAITQRATNPVSPSL
jgi:hypothetical protein